MRVSLGVLFISSSLFACPSIAEQCPLTKQLCDLSKTCHWSQDNKCLSSIPCVLENTQAECNVNTFDCVWNVNTQGCRRKNRRQDLNSSQRRPTIILSLADDLGNYDVGFNNPRARTPNLDRLRSRGVALDRYYSSRFCAPTRAMIMVGRWPWRLGLQTDANLNPAHAIRCSVAPGWTLLPGLLKRTAGYSTHMFGKWHLGSYSNETVPTARGFDTFVGYYGGGMDAPPSSKFRGKRCACLESIGCNQHSKKAKLDCVVAENLVNETGTGVLKIIQGSSVKEDAIDVFFARRAEEIILHTSVTAAPLFFYMAWASPHHPVFSPQRMKDSLVGSRPKFGTDARILKQCPMEDRLEHLGMVMALDEAHAILLDALDATDRFDKTIFVFLSDNGANEPMPGVGRNKPYSCRSGSSYPLRGAKFSWWEGGIRTLGFVTAPNRIPAGTKLSKMFSAVDWRKTLVSATGGQTLEEDDDGTDMWGALTNNGGGEEELTTALPLQIWLETKRFVILYHFNNSLWKILQGYPSAGTGAGSTFKPIPRFSRSAIQQPAELPSNEVNVSTDNGVGSRFECSPYCLQNLSEDPRELRDWSSVAKQALSRGLELIQQYKQQAGLVASSGLCDGAQFYWKNNVDRTDKLAIQQARRCGAFIPWIDSVTKKPKTTCT